MEPKEFNKKCMADKARIVHRERLIYLMSMEVQGYTIDLYSWKSHFLEFWMEPCGKQRKVTLINMPMYKELDIFIKHINLMYG